jgi:hypothetical protein
MKTIYVFTCENCDCGQHIEYFVTVVFQAVCPTSMPAVLQVPVVLQAPVAPLSRRWTKPPPPTPPSAQQLFSSSLQWTNL